MNPKRDQIIGEEGSTLRLTTTERRLKPRTSPESQPRIGFTGASKKLCPSSFPLVYHIEHLDESRLVRSVFAAAALHLHCQCVSWPHPNTGRSPGRPILLL